MGLICAKKGSAWTTSKIKKSFLEEITKADHQFSKTFFLKILYVLAELWIFSYFVWCFFVKKGSFSAKTTVREPRHTKNDQILSLRIFLGSFFTKRSIYIFAYGLYYSESLVSLLLLSLFKDYNTYRIIW